MFKQCNWIIAMSQHQTVLLNEAVDLLITDASGLYVDGTYGRGGHSKAILERLNVNGKLLIIDKDPLAIAHAKANLSNDSRVIIKHGSFTSVNKIIQELGWVNQVNGILLDLGVSSPQLDDAERGFSFMKNGPLDMRMDNLSGVSAAEWIAAASEKEIADVIYQFGEERYSRRIARFIVKERQLHPIVTTERLSQIVAKASPSKERKKHPATRTFQAIRIFINRELDDLSQFLSDVMTLLNIDGRMVVISFHSLEDRLVKRFIRAQECDSLPRHLPVRDDQLNRRMRKIGKPLRASDDEIAVNPRARSAIMRVAQKIA